MTLKIKRLIQKRQRFHQQGSKKRWKQLAGLIKRKIAERKKQYNRKKYSAANHDYWKEVKSLADPSNRQPVSQQYADDLNTAFHQVWNGSQQPDLNRFRSMVADPPAEPVFTYSTEYGIKTKFLISSFELLAYLFLEVMLTSLTREVQKESLRNKKISRWSNWKLPISPRQPSR